MDGAMLVRTSLSHARCVTGAPLKITRVGCPVTSAPGSVGRQFDVVIRSVALLFRLTRTSRTSRNNPAMSRALLESICSRVMSRPWASATRSYTTSKPLGTRTERPLTFNCEMSVVSRVK